MTLSASYSDDAVIPDSPPCPGDLKAFQDLLKSIAGPLQIPLEEVQEASHKLLDIFYNLDPNRVHFLLMRPSSNLPGLSVRHPP